MSTTMTAPAGAWQAVGMEDVHVPQVPSKEKRRTYPARSKAKVLAEYVRDRYTVHSVLDDRAQVVAMWRRLGLTVLQVAPGRF